MWAFPESTEGVALWYNKDLVREPPQDTDALLKFAEEVGLALNTGFYHSAGLLFGSGGKLFDENQVCIMDQGKGVSDGLAFLVRASSTLNVIADADSGKLDTAFKQGKVGMIINGPWATSDYVAALGADKLGIAAPLGLKYEHLRRYLRALPGHEECLPECQQPGSGQAGCAGVLELPIAARDTAGVRRGRPHPVQPERPGG